MASTAEKLIEEARALPPEERWRVVDALAALDDEQPADLPELQGEARARFIAGIDEALAQVACGDVVDTDEAQREMDAYVASLIASRPRRE